jgi:hypothetical protein
VAVVRLDAVRLAVPIEGTRPSLTQLRATDNGGIRLPSGARVWIYYRTAYVEASSPKFLNGNNIECLPVAKLLAIVARLVAEMAEFLYINASSLPEDVQIMRQDIVRDFANVESIPAVLDGLVSAPRPKRLRTRREGNWLGRSETLNVRAGRGRSWSATLYDKATESRGAAPPGLLRSETRLRKPRLQGVWASEMDATVMTLDDVSEERLERLGKASFDLVGFASVVQTRHEVVRRAVEAPGMSRMESVMLLGVLLADAEGVSLEVDDKTLRKYRRKATELGIRLSPDAMPAVLRLDWEEGRQVVEVA